MAALLIVATMRQNDQKVHEYHYPGPAQAAAQMVEGLLMELEDCNCWSIAEAAGHRGPHRLQHLLSRAVWDEQQVLDTAAAWAVSHLGDQDAVLIVDETADEKSSADAVISSPDLGVFAVAATGVLCAFPAWWTHYLNSVSAAGPDLI